MFDLHHMARTALSAVNDRSVILGASFDLSDLFCRELAAEGLISGYIRASAPEPGNRDPLHAGWWVDRRSGAWYPRPGGPATVVLLGYPSNHVLPGQMLLQARMNGIRRVVLAGVDGSILQDVEVGQTLLDRLATTDRNGANGLPDYDSVFDLLFRLFGDRLRLPAQDFAHNRVVLLAGSLGPGGAERQVAYTAAGLAQRPGCEAIVLCNHLAPPLDFFRPVVEEAGAKVALVPSQGEDFDAPDVMSINSEMAKYDHFGFRNILHVIFHYALALRDLKPSIVHTWMDYCNVLGGIAAELVGVPTLLLGGRSVAPDHFPGIYQPYMRPGYRALLRRRRVTLLNNSRAGATDYARWLDLPPDAVRVIHNGFDFPKEPLAAARERVRRELELEESDVLVGTISRFSEEKRPQLFIETAASLVSRYPQVRFIAHGGGVLLEKMRAFVNDLGLSEIVKLPGLTADAWSSLAAMDLFMLTSRMEGLPNVIVEAQASGLPVVCTGVGGMTETFVDRETGLSVPTATPASLAEAVGLLIENQDLRLRMSDKARQFAQDNFGRKAMVVSTLEAYRDAETSSLQASRQGKYQ